MMTMTNCRSCIALVPNWPIDVDIDTDGRIADHDRDEVTKITIGIDLDDGIELELVLVWSLH